MGYNRLILLSLMIFISYGSKAQVDSTLEALKKIPVKYINEIGNKIDKYTNRVTGKTEKTLAKLSRWENKIKSLLEKASPETAAKLFASNQTTFSSLLKKIQDGKAVAANYRAKYDESRDKIITSIKYLEQHKDKLNKNLIKPINDTKKKLSELEEDVANTEAVEKFIKERKKQLVNEAAKYIGKSKYLKKIDKEAFYYFETLRNYKEIFSDKKKAEEVAVKILNRIPAFKKFMEQNSMLASIFRTPTGTAAVRNQAGLQTRASVNALIQERIGSRGPNIQRNLQQGEAELNKLKHSVLKAGGSSSDANIPDFKPNMQKTKTFLQRLEYGSTLQFGRAKGYMPSTADIGLSVGYKLNDKSIIGIGASYKMGVGSIQRLSISHQGIGIRSFMDWKLKKQFFVTGGFEMNYNAQFKNISQLQAYNDWQQSGLVGITKKLQIKTKWFKGSSVQLLHDILYRQHIPVSQPVLFRMGYSFK